MAQQIGSYEIMQELGEGQFGKVWMAAGEVPGRSGGPGKRRTVAIKQLLSAADGESLRLLRQEFDLLDQVKHRSIVQVYEYLPTQRAVVMELVQGASLRTVLERCLQSREPIISEAAIEIGCEVADALFQAYTSPGFNGERLALVHRDLKPENIMLTQGGEVKILDFGLARVGNTEFAREDPRLIKGTPIYMAPEQARGEEIDHRSDLFALGLILYELLMGKPAYCAPAGVRDPALAMYRAIEQGELRAALKELNDRLPSLGPILHRLLQPVPAQRYQNGQELLVALRQRWHHSSDALQKFCTFYFDNIHDSIHTAPAYAPPAHAPAGATMNEPEKAPSKTIEERLREKEAAAAAPPSRAPVAIVRRAPAAPPVVSAPPSAPPSPPPVAPPVTPKQTQLAPRIIPRTASAARPASEEELPSVKGPAKPDARSASDAGMLQMKPLSAAMEEPDESVDPSATAFFAITPKAAARPPDDPPPAPVAAPPQPAISAGPPPSAILDRPAYSPPGGGGIGIGIGAASTPMMTAAGTPFGVHNGPMPNANQEKDVESSRIWVLLAGMLFMSGTLVVGVIVLLFLIPKPEKQGIDPTPAPTATTAPPPKDTGAPPPPVPTPKATPVSGPRTPKTPSTNSPPPTPKTVAQASGSVNIRFNGTLMPTSVELTCDSGFRDRRTVSGGSASFSGVTGTCTAYPKGVTTTAFKVSPGRSYNCTIQGTTTSC